MNRLKRVIRKILLCIISIAVLVSFYVVLDTAGVFYLNMTEGVSNIEDVKESDLKNHLPLNGKIYYVNTVLAEEYDEENSDRILNYYYLVDLDLDNEVYIILKADADSALSVSLDNLYNADLDGGEKYEYLLTEGVSIDGYLIENDSEVEDEYNRWKRELTGYGFDMTNAKLASYTIDCSETVSFLCKRFMVSAGILIVFVIVIIALIIAGIKQSRKNRMPSPAYGGYVPNGTGYPQNGYVPNGTSYPQNGYVPNGTGYPQNGYVPNGTGYPQNDYDQNAGNIPVGNYGMNNVPMNGAQTDQRYSNAADNNSVDRVSLRKDTYQ